MMHGRKPDGPDRYERASKLLIILLILGAVAVELAVPVLAWRWRQLPFPGLLFEQTLVVSGIHNDAWGMTVPFDASVRLVAVDGQAVSNSRELAQVLGTFSVGEAVTLSFAARDGGAPFALPVRLQEFPGSDWLSLFALPYMVGLAYLAIGIWVFRQRGDQRAAQSFALLCVTVALATGTIFDLNTSHVFVRFWTAAIPLTAAALIHLAFLFPEKQPLACRWPLIRFVPYPLALALAAYGQVHLFNLEAPWAYITAWRWSYMALGGAVLAFFGLMFYARARTLSAIVRQQVRIILIGSLLAFSPIAVYLVLAGLAVDVRFEPILYLTPLVIFPLFIAFAILRYKLLGMDFYVSRGLAYTLLTAGVAGIYFLILTFLGQTLGLDMSGGSPLFLAFFLAILLLILNPLRATMERWTDRLLGRRQVDYAHSLQEFSRELTMLPLEVDAILARLIDYVAPVSHSASVLIFLSDPRTDRYTWRQARGFVGPEGLDLSFGEDDALVDWLKQQAAPVYLLDTQTPSPVPRLPADERAKVEALGTVLFLPLCGHQGEFAGWVALGPRLSGEPYSPEDVAFLSALGAQTSMALENAQLLTEARNRAAELVALQQTALDISARRDIPVLLQSIVERATRLLGASGGCIHLLEEGPAGPQMRTVVSYNLDRDYAGSVLAPGEGVAGQVAQQGRPVRVEDYQNYANRAPAFGDLGARSVLGVPLKWQDRVLGVVDVADNSETRRFGKEDEWLLSLFASQAAMALSNAQLLTDLEQRVVQVDALRQISEAVDLRRDLADLLDLIYAQTSRVLAVDNFYVALYDRDRQEFRMAYYVEEGERRQPSNPSWPLGTGLTSQIVHDRQPIVTDDYLGEVRRRGVPVSGRPAKAWLGVPLLSGARVLGVLNVSSFQAGYRYSEEQVELMTAIADQAALAIDRMRLYQEMEARAAELATLNEISRTINSTLDLSLVLDLIMTKVVELLDVEAGSLLLIDEESGDLVFRVALGGPESESLVGRRHPPGKGIIGDVAQSGRAQIVNDVQADARWNEQVDEDIQFITRSILCVPMLFRDSVIGVIEVMNPRDGRPFLEEDATLLTGFASQAAVALENARLYTQTDQALARRVEELSTMQRIDRQLNAELDFERVMDMTLDWALRGAGAEVGAIILYDEDRQGMRLLSTRGYPPEYDRYRTELWPLDAGVASRVVRTGEPALIDDVSQDSDYHSAQPSTRSQLTVPIHREEQVIGAINVESPKLAAFDGDDLAFVQRLADHAAIAIENARLYRETERRVEEMALLYDTSLAISSHLTLAEVLETVYKRIAEVWDPPVFFIALYDPQDDALDFAIYVDRGGRLPPFRQQLAEQSGFSAWIVRNRRPILIRDWQKESNASLVQGIPIGDVTQSWLGVPLMFGDQMVGVMSVQDYVPNVYGQDHERFLTTVASQVAIAIENARLHAETERRLKEQTALREAGSVISSVLDLQTVLGRIAEEMGRAIDATSAYICSHDPETHESTVLAEYIGPEACAAEGVSDLGVVYEEVEPEFLDLLQAGGHDLSHVDDPDIGETERSHMQEYGAQTILYIPLLIRERLIGYTELWESRQRREFSAEEIALCQGIAQQAAIALENARLYEGVREANQAKSEFIDFVAHELKQPMTSMQGYAKMLTMGIGGELSDTQLEFVQVINSNVDRMGKLVNDLLEISRLEAGRIQLKLANVRLQEIVNEAVINTRTEIDARHHSLEVQVPEDLPPVRGDPDRLVQVLTNLMSNAYKYTPEGGTIRIVANGRDETDTPPGHLVVSVSDTGIGMTPQQIAQLDEKFFRADHDLVRAQPGTGLGVSITRNLVELHGGEFLVESVPGQGSTFRFTVPIAETKSQ